MENQAIRANFKMSNFPFRFLRVFHGGDDPMSGISGSPQAAPTAIARRPREAPLLCAFPVLLGRMDYPFPFALGAGAFLFRFPLEYGPHTLASVALYVLQVAFCTSGAGSYAKGMHPLEVMIYGLNKEAHI